MDDLSIELGGKKRRLFYDLNARATIGDALDFTVRMGSLGKDLLNKPFPLSAIRTILWAGFLHDEPDLTKEEVGTWIHQDNIADVTADLSTMLEAATARVTKKLSKN